MSDINNKSNRVSSGIEELDSILKGGLIDQRGYLIRGGPGAGKTTLGMHFLCDGANKGENVLFITLGESSADLTSNAKSIGLDASKVNFLDLSPSSDFFAGEKSYDLFTEAEMDRDPITKKITDEVTKIKPKRIFLDSTSHLRYLSINAHQFRKQLISFIRFLLEQGSIVLYTSEGSPSMPDDDVMYLSDGVINITSTYSDRSIHVSKFRGSSFIKGEHTLRLTNKGAKIYPILIPNDHQREQEDMVASSGVEEIDSLLHGGLEVGTTTLITGPAGVGKSTLALQFAKKAAQNNKRCVLFSFEESIDSILYRSKNINVPIESMLEKGNLVIIPVEPLLYTANEISSMVRNEVEKNKAETIIIDGISGYRLSVRGDVNAHLRALFKYVTNMNASLIAINETENITGNFKATEIGISYMADNIIFLRYLEIRGELKKAIGVLKKRLGNFERFLREFAITSNGIVVGKPLTMLRGILEGVPRWSKELEDDEIL